MSRLLIVPSTTDPTFFQWGPWSTRWAPVVGRLRGILLPSWSRQFCEIAHRRSPTFARSFPANWRVFSPLPETRPKAAGADCPRCKQRVPRSVAPDIAKGSHRNWCDRAYCGNPMASANTGNCYGSTVKATQAPLVVTGVLPAAPALKRITPSSFEQKLRTPDWLKVRGDAPAV
jgi:hypothetical protein